MDWFRSGGWLLGAKITNAVTFLQSSRKSTDGCKWRQAAFEWKAFLFVGNHLDNKIEAGTFTLKTTLAIVHQNHLGPSAALKKKLDVMVDRLTG